MTDKHWESFMAGYTHKETYTVEVECKTSHPIIVKQSTDYAALCGNVIDLLRIAAKETIITIR